MYKSPSEVVSHDVMKTCSHARWASREVLCDRNYMEVSAFTVFTFVFRSLNLHIK